MEFWSSIFKPDGTEVIKREFSIQSLGFENAKFLALK